MSVLDIPSPEEIGQIMGDALERLDTRLKSKS